MKINLLKTILLATTGLSGVNLPAAVVAHYPFDPDNSGYITETVSGDRFQVLGNFGAESQPGVKGKALYLDGYTSYVGAKVRHLPVSRKMTVSLWVAVPSYPVVKVDSPNPGGQTCIVNCLDDSARSGFGYFLGFDGQYSFQVYVGGEKAIVNVAAPLPRNRWNCLTAVVDADARTLRFYNNGVEVASTGCNGGNISVGESTLHVAQDGWEVWFGSGVDAFRTTAFGGLIDELTIRDYAASPDEMRGWRADAAPVLTVPDGRYAGDRWHPRFHGCPSSNWTNEPHGLVYADGRYHIFFQKNAAGPYMARLHWGHLTSTNLYDWQEERIALAPGEPYNKENGNRNGIDMKGCWSGCIYTDPQLTGGKPHILYTGVDYAKARILEATPADNSLLVWNKNTTPLIDGVPPGFTDDFRDPYFFRNGGNAYIMVGCQKWHHSPNANTGAVTRHRYDNGSWTSSDDFVYHGWDIAADGTYIEMPTMTQMPNGKWLFVYTPMGTAQGVKTMYRTGHIDEVGIFVTDDASTTSRGVDLFGRDGFGLLSPSIMTRDGRVTAIGLVPDKLGSADNKANGWAHCYSLPRDWVVDNSGNLWQKPAPELAGMRSSTSYGKNDFDLSGSQVLAGVEGREAEVRATFTCGNSPVGIRFFKNPSNPDHSHAALTIDPAAHTVAINLRHLPRIVNDGSPYDGLYQATLPDDIAPGKEVTVDLFIDHSVVDLFVNDRYAASVRIFPHDNDGRRIEMYADGSTRVKSLQGWVLDSQRAVTPSGATLAAPAATSRVAILIAEDNVDKLNAQERAAVDLFRSLYPEGDVLTPANVASRLSIDNYGTLWVHLDRLNIGRGNLPASVSSQQVVDALSRFHAEGGHLLLTKQAVMFVSRIGRIDQAYAPGTAYGDDDGGWGNDVWTLNAQIGWWQYNPKNESQDRSQYYDRRAHPIYDGLTTSQTYAWETFPMEGSGDGTDMWREDHNCMWDLNAYSYSAAGKNTVERFENQNDCWVLGTWGHVQDYAVAGVVEFKPQSRARAVSMTGRILANGLAACELAPRHGDNTYAANVERLNANSLAYLVADDRGPTISGVEETVADNKPRVFPVDYVGVGYAGVEPGTMMTIVSVDGRVLARRVLADGEGVVETPYRGVAVVTVGDHAVKLLLK